MSNEQTEETIMKKLALIVIAVAGFATMAPVAQAKPVGISVAEYNALLARSEGLNQLYGVHPHVKGVQVPVRGENYYARGIPGSTPAAPLATPSTSTDFQWGDAAIGAGALFGLTALIAMAIGVRRHRFHLGTS
jgi:hypothetical protein